MMLKAFKYRLYPTKTQAELINRTIGCARKIYNLMLGAKKEHYEKTKQTLYVTPAMFKKDYPYLKEADSLALANAQMHLNEAYNKFFAKPNEVGFPQFKSKHRCRLSYTTNNQKGSIRIEDGKIKLPKIGFVKIKEHRPHYGLIKSVTVSHERSGEYFVSVLCLLPDEKPLPKTDKHIGIDLGLHDFVVCSDGFKVKTPKFFRKSQKKLAKKQRVLFRMKLGSKNREKQKKRVAKCHLKIKNQRKDFLQKLSTKLIDENQVISLENLSVKGMVKNHKLAKSVSDASFAMFVSMLKYKAEWRGREVIQVGRYFPSTQLCHHCGKRNVDIRGFSKLSVREWVCPSCKSVNDRDLNAARNIDREGLNLRNVGDSSLTKRYGHDDGCHVAESLLHEKRTASCRA